MILYKHINNKDVAIEILKSYYVRETGVYKLKVRWWNIGPHQPFCMNIEQRLEIPKQKMPDWKPYTYDKSTEPRHYHQLTTLA